MVGTHCERVLKHIVSGKPDLATLAGDAGMPISDLAGHLAHADHERLAAGLHRLARFQLSMFLCHCQAVAASRLTTMTSGEGGSELARKACVDLLNTDISWSPAAAPGPRDRHPPGDEPDDPTVASMRQRVEGLLEALGADAGVPTQP